MNNIELLLKLPIEELRFNKNRNFNFIETK